MKAFTEALQHELRSLRAEAVPRTFSSGFRFHRISTARGRNEKPAGAWTPEQTVAFMMDRLDRGRLLHSLPGQRRDARSVDERRILWAGRRYRREPTAALPLASRLSGRVQSFSRRRDDLSGLSRRCARRSTSPRTLACLAGQVGISAGRRFRVRQRWPRGPDGLPVCGSSAFSRRKAAQVIVEGGR